MKSATLAGKALDYWMYRHACVVLDKKPSAADFDHGYKAGQFQFSQDAALLSDLLVQYEIRLQILANEWLASSTQNSAYGSSPLEATCRLVVLQQFGADVSE